MDGAHTRRRARPRRGGGILLELLLAIGIFAAAALFTLSALRSAFDGVRRAELRARALDLAVSRLAELDAGLVSVGDLGDERPRTDGLIVQIEVLPGASPTLARARAVVREVGQLAGGEPMPELARCERLIEQRGRTAREIGR
jgi:type II secretory pathway component PulJ